jgi:hypothetical protein
MSGPNSAVLKGDPYESDGEDVMEFRLTYEGPLMATQRDPVSGQKDARAQHKHDIRRKLHPQLKRLWSVHPFLKGFEIDKTDFEWGQKFHPAPGMRIGSHEDERPLVEVVAENYRMFNYAFVPLVTEDLMLSCALDVLFLRRDPPGSVVQSGDIDNRLKTLLDAFRIPKNAGELGARQTPADR